MEGDNSDRKHVMFVRDGSSSEGQQKSEHNETKIRMPTVGNDVMDWYFFVAKPSLTYNQDLFRIKIVNRGS